MWGAVKGALGWARDNLLGPAIGWAGEKDRRGFDVAQAEANRSFQERMRNTEWQAAVEDMRAAGINPAVAYSRGGASSPGGSMPGPGQNSVSSALQLEMGRKQLELLRAQIAKTQGEADSARAAGALAKDRAGYLMANLSIDGRSIPWESRKLWESEVGRAVAEAARAGSMAEVAGVGGQVAQGVGELLPAFRRVMGVAGQGANQMAGVLDVIEKAARMRDEAVRAWLGVPKAAVLELRRQLGRFKR